MGRTLKRLLIGVGVAAGMAGGVAALEVGRYLLHAHASAAREPKAVAEWRRAFGDPNVLLASYVHADDNAAARRLIAVARPLGIELRVRSANGPDVLPHSIAQYVSMQAVATADVAAPPDTLRTYLDAHQVAIDALVDGLANSDPPVWKANADIIFESDVSFLGIKRLNDVLLADALMRQSQNRPVDADRLMRAAWQVLRSVRDEPRLITFSIAMSFANSDVAVLRRLAVDPNSWRSRLGEFDYVEGVKRSMEAEAVVRLVKSPEHSMFSRAFDVDYLDGTRATLQHLAAVSLTDRLPYPAPSLFESTYRWFDVAPGRIVMRIAQPGLERMWLSAQQVMLNIELTDRVLDAGEEKTRLGHWPDAMSAVPSMHAPGASWIYRRERGGAMSIALDRALPEFNGGAPVFEGRR